MDPSEGLADPKKKKETNKTSAMTRKREKRGRKTNEAHRDGKNPWDEGKRNEGTQRLNQQSNQMQEAFSFLFLLFLHFPSCHFPCSGFFLFLFLFFLFYYFISPNKSGEWMTFEFYKQIDYNSLS